MIPREFEAVLYPSINVAFQLREIHDLLRALEPSMDGDDVEQSGAIRRRLRKMAERNEKVTP